MTTMRRVLTLVLLIGCGSPPREAPAPPTSPPPPPVVAERVTPQEPREESFAGRTTRPLDPDAFDAFIQHARDRLGVPGAAVAVTQGGRVVFERALGVREIGREPSVTPETLFMVGSITKPMTTLMQASLIDRGVFAWDTPIVQLLPDFAVGDAELTKKLTVWHMSCGCTGMPSQDLEYFFEYARVTPEQRIAAMRGMKPSAALGEKFQYSNLMVAAGGFAAARAAAPGGSLGAAYARVMKERLFDPIEMKASTVDFAVGTRAKDRASPHALDIDGETRPISTDFEANVAGIAPAGSAWSNLRDMEKYALTELGRGVAPNGTRIASEASYAERLRPRTPDGEYGLGIGVSKENGLTVLAHDGGSVGFGTSLYLLPDVDVGLVVLTNVRHGTPSEQLPFNAALKRRLLELLFEGAAEIAPGIVESAIADRAEATRKGAEGVERNPEAGWLAPLVGHYESESLGAVDIRSDAVLDVGEWRLSFGRRKRGEVIELVTTDAPFAGTPWTVGGEPNAPTLTIPDPRPSYVFRRTRRAP